MTTAKLLRAAGLRKTGSRLLILDLLQKHGQPLTHQEVQALSRSRGMDRVTLYRTLAAGGRSRGVLEVGDEVVGLEGLNYCLRLPSVSFSSCCQLQSLRASMYSGNQR